MFFRLFGIFFKCCSLRIPVIANSVILLRFVVAIVLIFLSFSTKLPYSTTSKYVASSCISVRPVLGMEFSVHSFASVLASKCPLSDCDCHLPPQCSSLLTTFFHFIKRVLKTSAWRRFAERSLQQFYIYTFYTNIHALEKDVGYCVSSPVAAFDFVAPLECSHTWGSLHPHSDTILATARPVFASFPRDDA